MRQRASLGLSVLGALLVIAVAVRLLGSRYSDIREEATAAIVLGAVVLGAAVWLLIRANRPYRSR